MAYQVITKSNNTFWLMTTKGTWVSSHHSQDEAIAACRIWFKCSPIVKNSLHRNSNNEQPPFQLLIKDASSLLKLMSEKFLRILLKTIQYTDKNRPVNQKLHP